MALIYRSIVEVPPPFAESGGAIFRQWLHRKTATPIAEDAGELARDGTRFEFSISADGDDTVRALRARAFEDRGTESVRTTFTALEADGRAWAWTDVERWTEAAFDVGWIPYAPQLVISILREHAAASGGTRLPAEVEMCDRDAADALCEHLRDPARVAPVVVVSPTREEREGDIAPCNARAAEMFRRLAGVARVVTLGPGATTALSKALHRCVGPDADVHSGAVRTYLPGFGGAGDLKRRHRLIPFHRLENRPATTAARLISLPLIQGACLQPPPDVWRRRALELPAFGRAGGPDADLEALLDEAERERDEALALAEAAERRRAADRETVDETLGQLDSLTRRIGYLEQELAKTNAAALHAQPPGDHFEPEWCEEVAREADGKLDLVVIGPRVVEAAEALDVHGDNASWARKAWRAFQALQAYAEAKRAGDAAGTDFKRFCQGGHAAAIPEGWVANHESSGTDGNPRFRALRTFTIDPRAVAGGQVYMDAHIKIEKGGTPCPRIHFYDDTDGATGKVHVGWFGDHLDSGAKS